MSTDKSPAKRHKGFVAVHIGAGYHSPANSKLYKEVCKNACIQAVKLLREKKTALEAVTAAMMALEDSEWTNAGLGSNLSLIGTVECDASIMDGKSSHYGAVGAVPQIKNPILVAESLLRTQMQGELSLGRIAPSTIVGQGAYEWAIRHNIPIVQPTQLMTDASRKTFLKNKRKLEIFDEGIAHKCRRLDNDGVIHPMDKMNGCDAQTVNDSVDGTQVNATPTCSTVPGTDGPSDVPVTDATAHSQSAESVLALETEDDSDEDVRLDTVGAICVDDDGWIASAVSSGGIILKQPGRLGQAALYGCGCWAENDPGSRVGVGVSTSGCGEQLSRTLFARTCADSVRDQDDFTHALRNCVKTKFMEAHCLRHEKQPLGGALLVTVDNRCVDDEKETSDDENDGGGETDRLDVEVLWTHTTDSMCLAYMSTQDSAPKALISRLPFGSTAGRSVIVQSKAYTITSSSCVHDEK